MIVFLIAIETQTGTEIGSQPGIHSVVLAVVIPAGQVLEMKM